MQKMASKENHIKKILKVSIMQTFMSLRNSGGVLFIFNGQQSIASKIIISKTVQRRAGFQTRKGTDGTEFFAS